MKNSVIGLLIVLCVGLCIFNYTSAEKNDETPNQSRSLENNPEVFDTDTTPRNYLRNGDFFSQGKPLTFTIDTGIVSKVGTSVRWYDKVINEFPGTPEAHQALHAKIRTLIGWEEVLGERIISHGLQNLNNDIYFPIIEEAYNTLESNYPDDPYLQAFAFQIGFQYYRFLSQYDRSRYKENGIRWFQKVIEFANGKETFYSTLANVHIHNLERF